MEEQVKISNVSLGEGKMSFTVELLPTPFWERQIKINEHRSIIKRALLDSLKHDAPYDAYISLVPEFGKIEVAGLEQYRKYNPAPQMRIEVPGLGRFLEDCGVVAVVEANEPDGESEE